jgi:penicillin-binding protein 2
VADRRHGTEFRQGRFRALAAVALLLFGAITVRLFELQVLRGTWYREQAEENRIRPEVLRAHRGRLLDVQGRVLADNAPSFHLVFDPRDRVFRRNRPALRSVVEELARILERDPAALQAQVDQARRAGLPPLALARGLDFATLSMLEERMEHLPGAEARPEPARRYRFGSLAAHLIGYVGEVSEEEISRSSEGLAYRQGDLIGRSGVERTYEEALRGEDGVEYVQVDALGRRVNLFPELPARASVPGHDVVLTLDLGVQLAAEAALDSIPSSAAWAGDVEEKPVSGCVVALDPRTGAVRAMASRPSFDPNLFVGPLSRSDWARLNGAGHPLLNRAIQSSYPPGSTFKMVTTLAGLHERAISPASILPSSCRGGMAFGNRFFRCHKKEGHGSLALIEAMMRSCDVYFYQVGIRLGTDRLTRYATQCSLGVATHIDLPQERVGLVPTIDWFERARGGAPGPGAALNLAIGQGELLLTPIGLARLVAAVCNGGAILNPYVVEEVLDRDGVAFDLPDRRAQAPHARLPATEIELATLKEALEAVVMAPGGTGQRAQVGAVRIAGKTGTAQNPHGDDHALFIAFAPVEDPVIVVVVVLEESGHGGAVAAPVAQRVLEAVLNPGAVPALAGKELP